MISVADINQIQQLYEQLGSIREVARELHISRNTVRKHLRDIYSVQEGLIDELKQEKRFIHQPKRVVSEELIQLVHNYLQDNRTKPRKQRLTGVEKSLTSPISARRVMATISPTPGTDLSISNSLE